VAGSLNECSFTNYNPALQQSLEIFGASAGGNELYIHAPKSSRYRHILRFGFMTADVMSLNVNDGSCQCDVEDHTYKLQILIQHALKQEAPEGSATSSITLKAVANSSPGRGPARAARAGWERCFEPWVDSP
jgi:hypothetical protein